MMYLAYRAFSNWRAIHGGKHIQFLVENKLLVPSPSKALDLVYAQSPAALNKEKSGKEEILLTETQIESCTEALGVPELDPELDRAVWQIEEEFKKEEEKKQAAAGASPNPQSKQDSEPSSTKDKKSQ